MGEISAEAVAAGVAALALVVTTVSLIYLARQTRAVAGQTRAVAKQTEISNAVAAVSTNTTVLGALREVHLMILERPGARRYFYDGVPVDEQHPRRDEIITIAELLADVLSSGIHAHSQVPDSSSSEPWNHYCRYLLRNSPVLHDLVRAHPDWWTHLPELLPPEATLRTEQQAPSSV